MLPLTKLNLFGALFVSVGLFAGCSKSDRNAEPKAAAPHHEHHPPHGGTPVELGEEENHVEIVVDHATGNLQAFVMDGELENFVRISAPSLHLDIHRDGRNEPLILHPVANDATGETVSNTSLFEAQANWLKTATQFDATLQQITVHGKTYTNIDFNFPKGADGAEHK